ncbi:MAG: hypothetical protein AB7F86_13430 [Bdellovibrionales bacterium]
MKKIFFVWLVMSAPLAQAGVLLEPILGYESGKLKCTTVGGSDCAGTVTAVVYGGRLGYKLPLGLWFAGEYNGSSGGKSTQPAGASDIDFDHTSIGATVGIDLLFGLRFFAGYNFSETVETKAPGASKSEFYGGKSTRFGIGYKLPLLPLAFNLEMLDGDYKKLKAGGTTYNVSDVYSELKHTGYALTISAPLDF